MGVCGLLVAMAAIVWWRMRDDDVEQRAVAEPTNASATVSADTAAPPLPTTGGVVASDHAIASQIGADILERGGNAIDAAAATALALGVVNPSSSGIGGGGFALVHVAADDRTYVIDFREVGPAAIDPGDFVKDGEVQPDLSRAGGLAVGVPGEVAGLAYMVERFGRLELSEVTAPAAALAAEGFEVEWFLAQAAERVGERLDDPALRDFLYPGGTAITPGQTVTRPALARTLEAIGARGAEAFYQGPIAEDMVAAVQQAGGVMTAADLAAYEVKVREPLVGRFADYTLHTMPLPSSGGIVILEALGILAATDFDLAELGAGSADAYHLVAEILEHGFADRARFLGDADPAALAGKRLLDPDRLERLAGEVSLERVQPHAEYGDETLAPVPRGDANRGGTSHLCVIDGAGNAVALTTTVNTYFGAKILAPGSGVVLNNEIDDFAIAPDTPNAFGLVQSEYNLVGPGKRPLSSMSPTLVLRDGDIAGCLGGSGGPFIISNTLQVFLNSFVHGMEAAAAVAALRLHHQWIPDKLFIEEVPAEVLESLEARGHTIERRDGINAVQLILRAPDGTLDAASDPRKRGQPARAEPPAVESDPPAQPAN